MKDNESVGLFTAASRLTQVILPLVSCEYRDAFLVSQIS